MILVFQLDSENSSEILFDQEGLNFLRDLLNKNWQEPQQNENNLYDLDHEHLLSNEWGGNELTPQFTSKGARRIDSVKMVYLGRKGKSLLS